MKKAVVALGGSALGKTPLEQLRHGREAATTIADLIELGYEVVVTHGNGPQVGMVNLAFEEAHNRNREVPQMPFPESGSMTQGYMGYHLQQAIYNEFLNRQINKPVVSLITQTLVDRRDPSFDNPSKKVGLTYNRLVATTLIAEKGYKFIEQVGKGYIRVVPGPKPVSIVEIDAINGIVENGGVVIAAGGGGIPVVYDNGLLKGIDAVIDKDAASAALARGLAADMLIILTDVDNVCINYKKENQEELHQVTKEELIKYKGEDQFAEGTMLEKIDACIDYLNSTKNGTAIITSLFNAKEAIAGSKGTIVKN